MKNSFKNRLVLLGIARWRGLVSINCDHRNVQPHRNLWLASQVKMKSFLGLAVAPFVTAYHCPGSSSTVHASCKARIVRTSPTHQSWHEFHRDVKAGWARKSTGDDGDAGENDIGHIYIYIMIITIGFFSSTMAWPLLLYHVLTDWFWRCQWQPMRLATKWWQRWKLVWMANQQDYCIYVTSVIFHLLLGNIVFFNLPSRERSHIPYNRRTEVAASR